MGCFHYLHLKKPSKPFFASLQLAVNVPVALCSADFLRLYLSFKTSTLVQDTIAVGMSLHSSFCNFCHTRTWRNRRTNRCGQNVRSVQLSWPMCLFGCSCVTVAERQVRSLPITYEIHTYKNLCHWGDSRWSPAPPQFIAHLGYLSGQHRTGLLGRAKNNPRASSSLSHVLNSETVKLLPGAFASYYRIPTFGVKRVN